MFSAGLTITKGQEVPGIGRWQQHLHPNKQMPGFWTPQKWLELGSNPISSSKGRRHSPSILLPRKIVVCSILSAVPTTLKGLTEENCIWLLRSLKKTHAQKKRTQSQHQSPHSRTPIQHSESCGLSGFYLRVSESITNISINSCTLHFEANLVVSKNNLKSLKSLLPFNPKHQKGVVIPQPWNVFPERELKWHFCLFHFFDCIYRLTTSGFLASHIFCSFHSQMSFMKQNLL